MKLNELFATGKPTLSFEVFPPKMDTGFANVKSVTEKIAALDPAYMSVTYGAGGGRSAYTVDIADNLQNNCGITALAHITCVSSTKEQVLAQLDSMKAVGIENVLALRGDIPADAPPCDQWEYHHASELVCDIKKYNPDLCIGGACYPEGHIERTSYADDIANLKYKVECGCDFLVTQMFFDNNIFYNFLYKIRSAGINVPVVAGIMPVANLRNVKRSCEMSGTELPYRFKQIVDHFADKPDAMRQAGIAYATEQIIDLIANGVNNIHVYTMNKPEIAAAIQTNISDIIG